MTGMNVSLNQNEAGTADALWAARTARLLDDYMETRTRRGCVFNEAVGRNSHARPRTAYALRRLRALQNVLVDLITEVKFLRHNIMNQ